MAKPDLEDGFLQIAYELYAAIAAADFTRGAQIVLWEVFAQVYGKAKLPAATLSPSEIARRCGMKRPHVARAIRELADAKVLIRLDDGSFRFVKDYETWELGEPEGQRAYRISYAHHAVRLARSYKSTTSDDGVPIEVTHQRSSRTNSGTDNCQNRTNLGTESVPELVRFQAPPGPPYKEQYKEILPEIPPQPPEGGGTDGDDTSRSGRGKDSPEAIELERWARSLGADRSQESYAFWAREACEHFPAAWVRLALVHQVVGRSGGKRAAIPYLTAILARWQAEGRCEHELADVAAGTDEHPPTVPIARVPPSVQRRNEMKRAIHDPKVQEEILRRVNRDKE